MKRLEQAMGGLCYFYLGWGHYEEGAAACRIATADKLVEATASGDELRIWVHLLVWQSYFSGTERACQLLQQSLTLLEGPALADQDTRLERAHVLGAMGRIAHYSGNGEEARRLLEQSLSHVIGDLDQLEDRRATPVAQSAAVGTYLGLAFPLLRSGRRRLIFAEEHLHATGGDP